MRRVIIVFALILTGHFLYAQIDSIAILENALAEGERMNNAFHNRDYDVFIEYSHPRIIEMVGGKEKMKEMLTKQGEIKEVSDMLISAELYLPQKLIIQDSTFQCSIIQKQIMNFDGQKFYGLSTLVGVSYDKGKKWFFISATKSLAKMQTVFPELSDDLEVIKQTAPTPLIE